MGIGLDGDDGGCEDADALNRTIPREEGGKAGPSDIQANADCFLYYTSETISSLDATVQNNRSQLYYQS